MSAYFRWTVLLGLAALAGCGGGGGGGPSGSSSSGSSTSSGSGSSSGVSGSSGSNVVSVIVNSGPSADGTGTFNIPYTSVTLCQPGTTTCATISNVLVDTGSYGLRIMASALAAAGLTQNDLADPNNAGNMLAESCRSPMATPGARWWRSTSASAVSVRPASRSTSSMTTASLRRPPRQ